MGTLLDLASLVVVPSGYKEEVVYSVKPTDGSGDLDFTRSNDTATRVNSAGLIEKVRTNLATYSSDFSQQYTLLNATISTNTITDPFGTSLADSHLETATSDNHAGFTDYTVISGTELTYSIYAKSIGGRNIRVSGSVGFTGGVAIVDLSNGTLLSGSTADAKVTSVGDGWYRISITATTTTTIARILVYSLNGTSQIFLGDITKGVYLFGRQLEYGVATDYIPTTTAAVSVGMTANVPRLDYSGGGCPKLLLEPQRTNLVTFSEQIDNAAWAKNNCTITANQIVSPSGYLDADLVTTTTSVDTLQQSVSVTSGTTYTFSGFLKSGSTDAIGLVVFGAFPTSVGTYNLTNGTATSGVGSPVVSIKNYGNGWYRVTLTATATSTGTANFYFSSSSPDAVSTYHVWGAQVEAGSYATSYIPTLAAAVTRGADACSKTGISSLIGQTEGVIYIDFIASAQNQDGASYSCITIFGTSNDNMQLYTTGATLKWYARITAGLLFDQTANETLVAGQRYKIAYAYKSGDWALYINGVQKRTNTSANIPATSQFNFNTDAFGVGSAKVENKFSQALLFPTRLTNTQLAELTTL